MAGLEGRRLDRYELRQLAGRGGMADVYRGYDTLFQRDVAVKVFKREDEELLRRFIREARLMASMNNPHLIPVFDTGMDRLDGAPYYYIVMPFMEGGSLRARTRHNPLPLVDACRYLREIADALDYIHIKGIIHRDIKSSNVLLDSDDNCYLADFGIARTTSDATQLTSTGNVLGTVDYVAPELFEPDYKADPRSDFYSLGVLAFEMVTGQLPFSAENQIAVVTMHMTKRPPTPSSIVQAIPPQLDRVILRSLEKNPDLRYQSATELAAAFCQAATMRGGTRVRAPIPEQQQAASAQNAPLILPAMPPQPQQGRVTRVIQEHAYMPQIAATPPPYPRRVTQSFGPPPPSPAQTRARVVTVIALLVLLAVVGPVVYVLLGNKLPGVGSTAGSGTATQTTGVTTTGTTGTTATATPNQTATAQAVVAATQLAKNGTATAIAGATATAQAQASATPGVIQTATTGTALYTDPLNNADSPQTQQAQWDANANCTFTPNGYQVSKKNSLINLGALKGCIESANKYGNMALSVDMTITSGRSGGVFFRASKKTLGAYAGYLFEVDNMGRYKLSMSSNFSIGASAVTIQDWTASTAIKTGAKNTLQIIASSNNFALYINGVYLMTPQDKNDSFTIGNIAFLASTVSGGEDAAVVYSNVSVYQHA